MKFIKCVTRILWVLSPHHNSFPPLDVLFPSFKLLSEVLVPMTGKQRRSRSPDSKLRASGSVHLGSGST